MNQKVLYFFPLPPSLYLMPRSQIIFFLSQFEIREIFASFLYHCTFLFIPMKAPSHQITEPRELGSGLLLLRSMAYTTHWVIHERSGDFANCRFLEICNLRNGNMLMICKIEICNLRNGNMLMICKIEICNLRFLPSSRGSVIWYRNNGVRTRLSAKALSLV